MAFRSAGQHHAIVAIVYHLHPQKHHTQAEGSLLPFHDCLAACHGTATKAATPAHHSRESL